MTTTRYRLVIGNKAWSSWSLRPWLAMRRLGLPFEEINVRLRLPGSKAEILKHSPSGLVPTLIDGDLAIWDSLAILEYLGEQHPEAQMWPAERAARAMARSVAAEMHSGFLALRQHCPMDLLAHAPQATLPAEVEADIRRIVALWRDCRARFGGGGPFLFSASRAPMRCMRLSPRAFAPTCPTLPATATTARRRPTWRRSSPCRRWTPGPKARAPTGRTA